MVMEIINRAVSFDMKKACNKMVLKLISSRP